MSQVKLKRVDKKLKDTIVTHVASEHPNITEEDIRDVFRVLKIGEVTDLRLEVVDARALHKVLQVGRDYNPWLADRLAETGAKEGVDYIKNGVTLDSESFLTPTTVQKRSAQKSTKLSSKIVTLVSLDLAKEISMLTKNDIGRAIRKYFILFEKYVIRHVGDSLATLENIKKVSLDMAREREGLAKTDYWKDAHMTNISALGRHENGMRRTLTFGEAGQLSSVLAAECMAIAKGEITRNERRKVLEKQKLVAEVPLKADRELLAKALDEKPRQLGKSRRC